MGYALYGLVYDWETFTKIIHLQGARDVGPQTLWNLISTPVIVNKVYYDGWYYFGFFALAGLFSQMRRYALIIIPSLVYFFFLLFSLTQRGQSGWYMIPLFPFMAMGSAIVLRGINQKPTGTQLIFLLLIGFVLIQMLFEKNFGLTAIQFRWLCIVILVPYALASFFDKKLWLRFLHQFYFYLAIVLAIFTTYTYIHPA